MYINVDIYIYRIYNFPCVCEHIISADFVFFLPFFVLAPRLWPLAATKRGDLTCGCGGACACEARRFGRKNWGGFQESRHHGVWYLCPFLVFLLFFWVFLIFQSFEEFVFILFSSIFRMKPLKPFFLARDGTDRHFTKRPWFHLTIRAGVRWPFVQMRVKWQDTWKRPWGWGVLNLRNGIPCLPEVMLLGLT